MSSPKFTDAELCEKFGRRPTGATALDQPQELGYRCPAGHTGDYLTWSEFNSHIWCYKCKVDYHYAVDCQIRRMCWMNDKQWRDFIARLPMKPKILEGMQHFPDCKIPHKREVTNAKTD